MYFGPGFGLAVLLAGMKENNGAEDKIGCGCLIVVVVLMLLLALFGAWHIVAWLMNHVHVTWN